MIGTSERFKLHNNEYLYNSSKFYHAGIENKGWWIWYWCIALNICKPKGDNKGFLFCTTNCCVNVINDILYFHFLTEMHYMVVHLALNNE